MEIIKTYLDNLFAGLPGDERLSRAKEDLLAIMEEHYNDLKSEGKSENEAVGAVIAQFGNIDELLEELEINRTEHAGEQSGEEAEKNYISLTDVEAEEYIGFRRSFGRKIGFAVMLCILAPAALIAVNALLSAFTTLNSDIIDMVSLVALLVLIASAVCIFIVFGFKNEKYECYEKEQICLSQDTAQKVTGMMEKNKSSLTLHICMGMVLIFAGIISVISAGALFSGFKFAEDLSVSVLLTLIGTGVMLFIKAGSYNDAFKALLNIDKKVSHHSDKNRSVAAKVIKAIIWPMTVIIFLGWSFIYNAWGISWIVFPIAGLINAIVDSVDSAVTESNQQ